MSHSSEWPDEADGQRLHAALATTDPTATAAFAGAYYGPLCAYLARTYRHVPEEVLVSVAGDLLLSLIRNPGQYDPERLALCRFLRMAAKRKLATAREREGRRRRREVSLALVAEAAAGGNEWVPADDGPSWEHPPLAAEVAALSPVERTALDLMRDGVRDTAAFARALGYDADSAAGARAVKRIKDTIKARLRRAVGGRT